MIPNVTRDASGPGLSSESSKQRETSSSRSFEEIMDDYWSTEERGSALHYLQTLSGEELRVVGREHGFANPNVNLYGITVEGSNNLLRSHGETIDENRDGIDQIGEARTWRFPNSNTPENVKAAWEESTAGLGESEKMLLAGHLFLPLPQVERDPVTGATRVIHPGEAGYQSPSQRPGYSYANTVANKFEALDDPSNPPTNLDFYRKAKAFYQSLIDSFERHAVA